MRFFLLKRSLAAPEKGLPSSATKLIREEMMPVISIGAPRETRKAGRIGLTMYEAEPLMTLMTRTIRKGMVKMVFFFIDILLTMIL